LQQRIELLNVLDRYSEVFSEITELCTAVEHVIPISHDFKPKSLGAYKVPQHYKAEVSSQIQDLNNLDSLKGVFLLWPHLLLFIIESCTEHKQNIANIMVQRSAPSNK